MIGKQTAGRMADVLLQPWSEGDLPLLEKLMGDPEMTIHLGGPQTPEQILKRHQRYLKLPATDHMFKIVWGPESEGVGSVGYWEINWQDQLVYETGWSVLPAYQGQGIATRATEAAIALARLEHKHQFMHAFPSNAICRKLGFLLVEECQFEYWRAPGNFLTVNDWRIDLFE
jgi:RimJ/RimL family protein N-acetyltransferase